MDSRGMALFVESDQPIRLSHLATMVMSAVLLDRPVVVIWMGAALRKLMDETLDEGFAGEGAPSALLREARLLGKVSFLACSADARHLGRNREELLTRLDDVFAMTTILRRIEGAATVLYL